jgi:GR25 family glycosyltransferase involved in LPS biosynthesis
MMGLGAFACRRGAWPGLNPRLNGFGGEEGYLHEKFRRKGARCLCLPFFRWTHRFPRPMGVPYPLTFEDRARNYLITHYELGWDPGPVIRHLEKCVGEEKSRALIEPVQAETSSPFHVFDEAWCINVSSRTDRWEAARRRFQKLGIATKVSRFAAAETPLNHHIGCALSHRRIIEDARRRDLESVLVFEDDVVFTSDTAEVLRLALVELRDLDWQILYLGGCRWEPPVPIPGHKHLVLPQATTCTQSLVYHRSVYGLILEAVPDNAVDVAFWLRDTQAIDQFYAFGLDASLYLVEPVIASQPNLFGRETRIFDK